MKMASDGQGNFLVLGNDGKWTPAPRAVNPETGQSLIFDGTDWQPESLLKGKSANEAAPPLDNLVRGIARGATLGFADELAAAGSATFGQGQGDTWGQRYSSNLEAERSRDKAFDATNPLTSAGAQIGGAVLGARAVPMVQPFTGGGMGATLGNTAANSAIGGAVAGFGEGEGAGDRLKGALSGGALGAVAGPALHGVFDLGQRFGRKVGNVLGLTDPAATSERLMARALMRDKIPADELSARAGAATDPQILADIAGRNTVGLSGYVARTPSDAPQIAETVMALRRDARPDRIAAVVDKTLGGGAGDDVFVAAKRLDEIRKADAAPLYEKAFAQPVTIGDARKVQRFVTDPIGQDALQNGMRVIELEHLAKGKLFDPEKYGVTRSADSGKWIIDPDILAGGKAPSFRLMDAVKRGFDEIVEGFRDPTSGRLNLNQYGRAVNDVRATYRDRLKELNPTYGEALKAWSDPSQSLDALRRGQQMLRTNRDVTRSASENIAEQDRPFFELGVGRALADMTSDPASAGNAARRLTEDRQMGERLASVLPDQGRRSMLVDALRNEAAMARNDRIIAPSAGSQTQPLQALGEDMANEPLIARMLMHGRTGGIGGAVSGALSEVYRRGQGINSNVADALAPRLFGTGPEAIKSTLEAIRARQIADETARRLIGQQFQRSAVSGASSGALLTN
jgi:hypothetical protein